MGRKRNILDWINDVEACGLLSPNFLDALAQTPYGDEKPPSVELILLISGFRFCQFSTLSVTNLQLSKGV